MKPPPRIAAGLPAAYRAGQIHEDEMNHFTCLSRCRQPGRGLRHYSEWIRWFGPVASNRLDLRGNYMLAKFLQFHVVAVTENHLTERLSLLLTFA
jgi:hypothetical protein